MAEIKTKKDILNALFVKYELSLTDDIFSHKNMFKIITRSGIEKIQNKLNIQVDYDLVDPDLYRIPGEISVVFKTTGTIYNEDGTVKRRIVTFGESNDLNLKQRQYPFAMAEKRGLGRVVLKLAGLYEHQVFSEDEADAFGDSVKKGILLKSQKIVVKTEEPTENELKNG